MNIIENQTFDEERALYGSSDIKLIGCSFDGPADGESALKESRAVTFENGYCNLRYPFWHNHILDIANTEMTSLCRAALWYSDSIRITNSKLHGIKALRECQKVLLDHCDIISPEFGWSVTELRMLDCTIQSEYFLMRSEKVNMNRVELTGKYSFQYMKYAHIENCVLHTKDAFWHASNLTITNSVIEGEYLGWYSDYLTFENCKIVGTQPLCYCKHLKLINCEMIDCDLAFEKSDVEATITSPVISIKNPRAGRITVPSLGELIHTEEDALCEVIDCSNQPQNPNP